MKVTFLPSNEANTAKIPGQDVAMIIAEPDAMKDAPADKQWPAMFFLHGKDNLGGGTLSSLQTYWEGPFSGIPEDWKKAVDKYGIIGVALHYGGSLFSYTQWRWAYEFIRKRYNTYEKVFDAGFSWGGGSIQKCMCTMVEYCMKNAIVMPIAPTVEYNGGWVTAADSRLPVWVVVNKGDNVTGTAAAKKIVDSINASGATIKATYTELNQNGHGGKNEAMGLTPMPGFAENAYELFLDILKNGPRAPKLGTSTVPPPTTVPPSSEPATNEIVIKQTGTYPNIKLDASDTVNRKSVRWTVKSVPTGRSIWEPIVMSGQWHFTDVVLPTKGTYGIECYVTFKDNTTASKLLSITWGDVQEPEPPQPIIVDIPIPEREIRLIFTNGNKYVLSHTKLEDIVNNYITEETKTSTL